MKPLRLECLLIAALVIVALTSRVFAAEDPPENDERPNIDARPNIIVIYTDDQGSYDLNCYGSHDLATPHLDRLANRGIRFTQMYAPSAICSSSRAGLMTGRYPVRAGVPNNVSSAYGHAGLPVGEVTMAEMLGDAGYVTAHVGKWHLGYTPETMPLGQGFASSYGHMGGCIDNYSHFFYWNGPNRHDLWRDGKQVWEDGQYFPDLMVRECCDFLEGRAKAADKKPFFLYWALNIPHYPMQGTEKWREHYKDMPSPRRQYATLVSTMDEKIGEVLNRLSSLGITRNTIVIVQSDHGHSVEERAFFGGGNAGELRGAKGCLFEGGLRVPAIVSWPAKIAQAESRDQLACGIDWYPTLAEFAGATVTHHLDGKSMAGFLKDGSASSPHQEIYWQLGRGDKAQWVVRSGDWKLLGNPQDRTKKAPLGANDKRFLVNLANDKGEMKNVAAANPKIVERLAVVREQVLGTLSP